MMPSKPSKQKSSKAPVVDNSRQLSLQRLRTETQQFQHDLRRDNRRLREQIRRILPKSKRSTTRRKTASVDELAGVSDSVLETAASKAATTNASLLLNPAPVPPTSSFPLMDTLHENIYRHRTRVLRQATHTDHESVRQEPASTSSSSPGKKSMTRKSDLLNKSEKYFDDLQSFRQQYPQFCFQVYPRSVQNQGRREETELQEHVKSMVNNQTQSADKATDKKAAKLAAKEQQFQHLQDRGYYTGGYFTLNERYFPEESVNPFLKDMTILKALELDEDTDAPPVKISIPHKIRQPVRRQYKLHTRQTYEPMESVNLEAYLHSGYVPFHLRSTQRRTLDSISHSEMSFKRSIQQRQREAFQDLHFFPIK